MSDSNQADRVATSPDSSRVTSDLHDAYVYRLVTWTLSVIGTVLFLGGAVIIALGWMLIDEKGPGTPLALKLDLIVGGLSMVIGSGLCIVSFSVPAPPGTDPSTN